MTKKKFFINALIFITVAFALNFFEAKFAQTNAAIKYVRFALLLGVIGISALYFFIERSIISFAFQIMCASIIISIVVCKLTWNQGYKDSLTIAVPLMLWFFYFFLKRCNVPVDTLEKIVLIYGVIYILLFVFQTLNSGSVYFGFKDEFTEDRGVTRIDFPGGGVFFLSTFIALSRYTEFPQKRIMWGAFLAVAFVVTIAQVTRQNIAAVVLVYVYHFMKRQSISRRVITMVVLVIAASAFILSENTIVKGFQKTEKTKNGLNQSNYRVMEANFFLTRYYEEDLNRVLGNGVPYSGKTTYGIYEFNLRPKGLYFSDVGMIAIYCYFGIGAILAYIILFVRTYKGDMPEKYTYLRYYAFYLLVTGFTSGSTYSASFLITNVFVFYSVQAVYTQVKEARRFRNAFDWAVKKNYITLPNDNN